MICFCMASVASLGIYAPFARRVWRCGGLMRRETVAEFLRSKAGNCKLAGQPGGRLGYDRRLGRWPADSLRRRWQW